MKIISSVLLATGAVLAAVRADDTPAPETTAPAPDAGTVAPGDGDSGPEPGSNIGGGSGSGDDATMPPYKTGSGPAAAGGKSTLEGLKQETYGNEYHMPAVRVVQARVQGDQPVFIKDRFVSTYGKGDYELGYRAGLDTVNTASVEGALMFVQAEGIDVLSRAASERCRRKNDMKWIVLYEIMIAQTNETIAQFSDRWNIPEYGPMQPMDAGMCTPISGNTYPPECLQFNGDEGQPNLGPYVGGGGKQNEPRAPYPDNYWFSFPNSCPLKKWPDKEPADDACRKDSRQGLCDINVAPDGVKCTFAYDIIGWVPIDDVVGITSMQDSNGKYYKDFAEWCESGSSNIEFQRGSDNSMVKGLPFWKEPNVPLKNAERAAKVVNLYQKITAGEFVSELIDPMDLKHFKELPDPANLAKINPPCYKSVPKCNSGNGCARKGFSQLCKPCANPENGCLTDPSFTFPTLEKAKSELPPEAQTSIPNKDLGATGTINGTENTVAPSPGTTAGASSVELAVAAFAVAAVATFASL